MFNTVTGKKIALFRHAFLKDNGDVRETLVMFMLRDLLEENAIVHVYDPEVKREDMWTEMNYTCGVNKDNTKNLEESVITATDPYAAAEGAHAIAILAEWDVFKTYDYEKLYNNMSKPAFVFDGRNLLDHDSLRKIEFVVCGIGKPDPKSFIDL